MRALSGRRSRAALSLLAVAGALIAPVVASSPPAAAAPQAAPTASAAARGASTGPTEMAQASARARATGKPVVVNSLTTATSQTAALPDGQLRLTESLLPVRTMRGGTWVTLDPRLEKAAGGRITPAVTARPLSLSGGGAGPLAVLDNYGRRLTLTWPGGSLPTPVVTGATATYPNVEPGIDLAVTATSQGDISELAIIHSAAAATGPGLAAALQLNASGPGLTVTAGQGGGLEATTGPGTAPTFDSPAPQVWDSAAPPAGTATATVGGATVVAPSGLPADSTSAGPGAYAHVSTATQSASGGTITVAPPAGSLSGSGVVYPVYVDPAWAGVTLSGKAVAWTMIESGYPTTTGWDQSGAPYLEVGYCDPNNLGGCNGIGVTRSMFRFNLPGLPANTTVTSADVYVDDLWSSANCAAEPLQLYRTVGISSSSDWSNTNSGWGDEIEQETIAGYGSSGCPSSANDVKFGSSTTATGSTSAGTLASTLTTGLDDQWANITLGLKAADESTTDGSAWLQWRYFQDTAADISLSFTYHYPPAKPTLTIEPAGGCQTQSAAQANPIGDDDITIDGTISDGDGDTALTTKTTVYNSGGTAVQGPWTYGPGAGVTGQTLGTIARGTLASGLYSVTAVTTDAFGETATSDSCYFYVDLTAPSSPVVAGLPNPAVTTLGAQLTGLTFSPGSTCTGTPNPCPTKYTYQIGDRAPVTVNATSGNTYVQPSTGPGSSITVPVLGPFDFSVSGTNAAGNASPPTVTTITSMPPTTPVPDGYFTDGGYPDLLTTNPNAGADASVWLSPGTGNGQVGPAVDIGGLGNEETPGTDGPADWDGNEVIQGDLTGENVQDVMGYSTTAAKAPGDAAIIGGTGSALPPNPKSPTNYNDTLSQNSWQIAENYGDFCDPTELPPAGASDCPPLADVVFAGNASLEGSDTNDGTNSPTNNADLIGIYGPLPSGDPDQGDYELNLYTALNTSVYGIDANAYSLDQRNGVLSATSPDGSVDWQDYTLGAVELPDTTWPHGDPSDIALLALNDTTGGPNSGKLWVSTGSGCSQANFGQSGCLLTGMSGTWAPVTGTPASWATAPAKIASADVNSGSTGAGSGTPEIWTVSGGKATAYAISGIGGAPAATQEGSGSPLTYPADSWALNDGALNPAPATATDSVTGTAAPVITGKGTTTWSWAGDHAFGEVLQTSNGYVAPAADPVPAGDTTATLSVWFKANMQNQALVSLETGALSSGAVAGTAGAGGYSPLLYIGADGKLLAKWHYGGGASGIIESQNPVNDGLWHHAVLTGSGSTQTLTIDGVTQGSLTGTVDPSSGYFYIGAGLLGGTWPDEKYYEESGNTGYVTHFNGEIADVTFTK